MALNVRAASLAAPARVYDANTGEVLAAVGQADRLVSPAVPSRGASRGRYKNVWPAPSTRAFAT